MKRNAAPPTTGLFGRTLARPDAELVDQGLDFDLGTVFGRRRLLVAGGVGALGAGLAADVAGASTRASTVPGDTVAEIPEETAGPYPGDGSNGPDALEASGIVRRDITTSFGDATGVAEGVATTVELTVVDLANGGAPFVGAALYLWHCSREGGYSMYSAGVEDENFLRGVQIADDDGRLSFTTIFPACYTGRWPHMHFEVFATEADITDATSAVATSQLAIPADVCDVVFAEPGYEQSVSNLAELSLATDGIFADDGAATQLARVTGDVANGYVLSLVVGVDTTTEPGAAAAGGGDPGRGPRR